MNQLDKKNFNHLSTLIGTFFFFQNTNTLFSSTFLAYEEEKKLHSD